MLAKDDIWISVFLIHVMHVRILLCHGQRVVRKEFLYPICFYHGGAQATVHHLYLRKVCFTIYSERLSKGLFYHLFWKAILGFALPFILKNHTQRCALSFTLKDTSEGPFYHLSWKAYQMMVLLLSSVMITKKRLSLGITILDKRNKGECLHILHGTLNIYCDTNYKTQSWSQSVGKWAQLSLLQYFENYGTKYLNSQPVSSNACEVGWDLHQAQQTEVHKPISGKLRGSIHDAKVGQRVHQARGSNDTWSNN